MRALIFSLVVLAALPARAQTSNPSREALALGSRVAHAAQPQLDHGVQTIVDSLQNGYRDSAVRNGQAVDEKVLADAGKNEVTAARPLLWDGMAKIYAQTFTVDELKALEVYYRSHPGDPAALPAGLAAKNALLPEQEQTLIGRIGPRIIQDLFGDYCSRAPCPNELRRTAGLPIKENQPPSAGPPATPGPAAGGG
jgi:hypothetical protein